MLSQRIFVLAGYLDSVVIVILLILSVISVALILERWFFFRRIERESDKSKALLEKMNGGGNLSAIIDLVGEKSLEGNAAKLILDFLKAKGLLGVDELFNSHRIFVKNQLDRSLGFLATIGSNAPYIGLLGTVFGIMKAFHDLSYQTEAGVQTVMAGISGALLATAAGLFVAIPAVIAYNYFQRKTSSYLSQIQMVKDLTLVYWKTQQTVREHGNT
ncbi:MAG: MotA/TolQ/ExbB proton channel family protein [Bdellovibrionaceae bacterium]|nr:MotA/TolQ/ExbB proton channel family protein [Pseudobdellovibrionaceae bacterium]MDW8189545.1 MotA/TolQ/ExbB proton channel family protein [Pseudobdellovibrionaceae bacterium]